MSVQSLLFDRDSWTESKAKAWAKSHGYQYGKVDVTDQYIRIRQFDPKGSKTKRTIPFGRGIRAVVAREEKMARTAKEAPRRRRRSRKKASRKSPRRRRRVRATATVAAPKRRRRRRAKKTQARRRRRRVRATATVAAPRRRRRRRSRVMAWRGDSAGHAKAARKGHRRRKARRAGRRRTHRRRRARETVMEAPRRRRRRRHARASAPYVASRRRRRRHGRRMRSGVMMASGGSGMGIAELGVAVITGGLGFVLADGVDRFLATYNPSSTSARPTDKFTSDGAGTLANTLNVASRPSLIRIGAGGAMVALPAFGAYASRRSPMARAAFEGATLGAGISLFKSLWNNVVMPLLAPKDTSPASLQKSIIVRLYPAEVAAKINMQQKAVSPGVLSGPPQQAGVGGPADVGPFALAAVGGDSPYLDTAQALRRATGVQDPQYPSLQNAWGTGGDSDYPSAAQALRREAGMGWQPGPPSDIGPGPQAQPHKDCGCVGDPTIGFAGFLGDSQEKDSLFTTGAER